jgi:hypothetical protein
MHRRLRGARLVRAATVVIDLVRLATWSFLRAPGGCGLIRAPPLPESHKTDLHTLLFLSSCSTRV